MIDPFQKLATITPLRPLYISQRQLSIRMYRKMRLRQVLKVSKLLKDINVDPFINIPLILGRPGARAP